MDTTKKSAWGGTKQTIKRIFTLTAMQLKNMKKKLNITSGRKAVNFVLGLLKFALVGAIYYGIITLVSSIFSLYFLTNYRFFIFYLAVMQLTSIISCTGGLMQSLFLDQDNSILLSFPCRHSEVFLSKLAVYYVSEFKKSLYFILPYVIIFGIMQQESQFSELPFDKLIFFLWLPFVAIIVPLIPVLIGSLLSLPFAYLKRFVKQNVWVKLLLFIVIIALCYYATYLIIGILPDTIEIITRYIVVIEKLRDFIYMISSYCLYVNFFVYMMFTENMWINFAYIMAIVLGGIILTTLIIMPFYFNIASHSMEDSVNKKHKNHMSASKTVFGAFLKKELIMTTRDFGSVVSGYVVMLMMPIIVILILSVYERMKLDATLAPFLIYSFITMMVLMMTFSNNSESACAITKEGAEFVLIKTAPNKVERIAWAKLLLQTVIFILMLSIAFGILYGAMDYFKIEYTRDSLLYLYLISLISNIGLIFWAFQLDIRDPRLQEYASTKNASDHKNSQRILTFGIVFALILTLVFAILNFNSLSHSYIVLLGISVVFLIARVLIFRANLYVFFEEIEL